MMDERELADLWFGRLEKLLAGRELPCEYGPARVASADEFMFMGLNSPNAAGFKHRDSRNYVYVEHHPEGDFLVVPRRDKFFHRGFFDKFDVPVEAEGGV